LNEAERQSGSQECGKKDLEMSKIFRIFVYEIDQLNGEELWKK